MRIGPALAFCGAMALASWTARAQVAPSLDLRGFRPPTHPESSLFLEPTSTPGPGAFNVGAWGSYAYRLFTLRDQDGSVVLEPVQHQVSLDYVASIGLGERVSLGLSLPTVLYQTGDDAEDRGLIRLPATALGDVGFRAKATLLPGGELGGFGLAAIAHATAPTGNQNAFVGEGVSTGGLDLLAELRLIALAVRASAGARIRGEEELFQGEAFGHVLPWAFGITLRPQAFGLDDRGRWDWTLESRGAIALTPRFAAGTQSPVSLALSGRYSLGGDVSLIGGVEAPLNDAVGNPSVRVILGIGWAPRFYDADGDGVADADDECPELAEDLDGFEDHDGCPDFDNDDDGVPDDEDRCPREREDEDDFEDDDGCIDPDNDKDGIPDEKDSCPDEPGPAPDGCPPRDEDGDGLLGPADRCPEVAEDGDGIQDDDGCPETDADGDDVPDLEDACPLVAGPPRSDPRLHGCPSPDRDGDGFDDAEDRCPDQPESFDGVDDGDGCPEATPGEPLVRFDDASASLRLRVAPTFVVDQNSVELTPESMPTLRAIAQLLNAHPERVPLVAVRPAGAPAGAAQQALSKSFAIVHAVRRLTHRDGAAESVSFRAVRHVAEPSSGVGVMVLGASPAAEPAPAGGEAR